MRTRKRSPKRGTPDFDALMRAVPRIAALDTMWRDRGYQRTRARASRRRDGTFTVRIVWRNRDELVSAITCTFEGLTLA